MTKPYTITWGKLAVDRAHPWGEFRMPIADRTLQMVYRGHQDDGRASYAWTLNSEKYDGRYPVTFTGPEVRGFEGEGVDLVIAAFDLVALFLFSIGGHNYNTLPSYVMDWAAKNAGEIRKALETIKPMTILLPKDSADQ